MKLIHLYVENYKTLYNLKVDFEPYYIDDKNQLIVDEQIRSYNSVDSISCFIGKNGVGKSTLLEVLIKIFLNEELEYSFQLVFESESLYYSIGTHDSFGDLRNVKYISKITRNRFARELITFYSPIYNPHNSLNIRKGRFVDDVSNDSIYRYAKGKNRENDLRMQFLFLDEMEKYSEKYLNFEKYYDIDIKISSFQIIKKRSLNTLYAIKSYTKDVKSHYIELYNKILVDEDLKFTINQFLKTSQSRRDKELKQKLSKTLQSNKNLYEEYIDSCSVEDKIVNAYCLDIFFRRSLSLQKEVESELADKYTSILTEVFNLSVLSDVSLWLEDVKRYVFSLKNIENDKELIKIDKLKKVFSRYKNKIFPLSFKADQVEEVMHIVSTIRRSQIDEKIIYKWRGVSSGQLAKLNLYSRIYFSLSKSKNTQSFLLILDEADIYLHPDWQINFFNELFLFIKELRKAVSLKNVNLVLTTHSPLMITDLYSDSVYKMNLYNGKTKIERSQENTFASNIYDLYDNEFSIKHARGTYATKKVEAIIKKARSKEITKQDEVVIDSIGEPIIRHGINYLRGIDD